MAWNCDDLARGREVMAAGAAALDRGETPVEALYTMSSAVRRMRRGAVGQRRVWAGVCDALIDAASANGAAPMSLIVQFEDWIEGVSEIEARLVLADAAALLPERLAAAGSDPPEKALVYMRTYERSWGIT